MMTPCSPVRPLAWQTWKKALNLLVHPANRLHFALLVDRAGDRDALLQRDAGEAREECVKFGGGGGVPVDAFVGLLETEARGEGKGSFLGVLPAQVATQNEHPLIVDSAAELGFPLDVNHATRPRKVWQVMRDGLPNITSPSE